MRCKETYSNYLTHVRVATLLVKGSDKVFAATALKRAKDAIKKRGDYTKRPKMFLRSPVVQDIIVHLLAKPEWRPTALWALAAYIFLLRVPSECLPMVTPDVGDVCVHGKSQSHQSMIWADESQVVLCLRRRKNMPEGAKLTRRCWCSSCPLTCPVHILGAYCRCALLCTCPAYMVACTLPGLSHLGLQCSTTSVPGVPLETCEDCCKSLGSQMQRSTGPMISGGATLKTWLRVVPT